MHRRWELYAALWKQFEEPALIYKENPAPQHTLRGGIYNRILYIPTVQVGFLRGGEGIHRNAPCR